MRRGARVDPRPKGARGKQGSAFYGIVVEVAGCTDSKMKKGLVFTSVANSLFSRGHRLASNSGFFANSTRNYLGTVYLRTSISILCRFQVSLLL